MPTPICSYENGYVFLFPDLGNHESFLLGFPAKAHAPPDLEDLPLGGSSPGGEGEGPDPWSPVSPCGSSLICPQGLCMVLAEQLLVWVHLVGLSGQSPFDT